MLMLFPTSGRHGFRPIESSFTTLADDKDILKAMLRRDIELRLSDEIQNEFDAMLNRNECLANLCERVQRQVVTEFGFELESGLNFLRSAVGRYPNDSEISDIAFYIKYNRSEQGSLRPGDRILDADLWSVDQQPVSLLDYYHQTCQPFFNKQLEKERALVVLAGSIT